MEKKGRKERGTMAMRGWKGEMMVQVKREKKREDGGKGAIDGETGMENGEGRERKRKRRGSVVLMSSPAPGRK